MVDLAEVNGRVFVNNVSLGLYAEAVQHEGYRDAKLRTLLDTVPDVLGPAARASTCAGAARTARAPRSGAVILVSNNRYRLGRAVGSGTRPRIDDGLLGITVIGAPGRRAGAAAAASVARVVGADFEVDADRPVAAGIDGEALRSTRRSLPHPPGGAAGADRPAPTRAHRRRRRLPDGHLGGRGRAGPHRRRA